MARRRKLIKDVRCTVKLMVSGVTRKTVKRHITIAQAVREIGGDSIGVESRIIAGGLVSKKRTVARGVSVVLMYHRPNGIPREVTMIAPCNIGEMRQIIRAGVYV